MAEEKLNNKKPENSDVPEKDEPKLGPLELAEFRSVFEKVKSLGLTWTADIPPRLIPKEPQDESATLALKSTGIQERYPMFPTDLGSVVFYILTGRILEYAAGDKKLLKTKTSVVRESGLVTESYRAEFFFKHSIKVPYFSDLDWEVVVKRYERNVRESPGISYALLSLEFEGPGTASGRRRTVVAVDERIAEKLMKSLAEVKEALERCRSTRDISPEKVKSEDKDNAITGSTNLLGEGKESN